MIQQQIDICDMESGENSEDFWTVGPLHKRYIRIGSYSGQYVSSTSVHRLYRSHLRKSRNVKSYEINWNIKRWFP